MGPDGQLLGALQVLLRGRVEREDHPQGGQEVLPGAREVPLLLPAFQVQAVQVAPPSRVDGLQARLELGALGDPGNLRGGQAQHLGVREGHLLALVGLVVHEGQRIQSQVQGAGDGGHRGGLGPPADLRGQEILPEPELLQASAGQVRVVAAGQRVQDAALVQGLQGLENPGAQPPSPAFQQDPFPEGLVQVPDQALHLALFQGASPPGRAAHRLGPGRRSGPGGSRWLPR